MQTFLALLTFLVAGLIYELVHRHRSGKHRSL